MVTNGDYIMMIRAQRRLKLLAFFRKILSLELRQLLPLLLLEVAGCRCRGYLCPALRPLLTLTC